MLREARIIMPYFGTELSNNAHLRLRQMLCEAFGGFTAFEGSGGWRSPAGNLVYDNVTIYDVAMDGDKELGGRKYDALERIALEAGRALDQQSVYVRYCNGVVNIMPVLSDEERNEKAERLLHKLTAAPDDDAFKAGAMRLLDDAFKAGAMHLLEDIFGKGNVVEVNRDADMGDGNSAVTHHAEGHDDYSAELPRKTDTIKSKPHPGQLWSTRGGGKAFVGRRATVHEGGWYATLVETQAHYRAGFEYVVDFDGYLAGHREIGDSSLDLVSILA